MKTDRRKKRIALLLAILLAIGPFVPTAAAADSGSCGDNLTWAISDGTLTIQGTGEMNIFPYENSVPWYDSRSSIRSVNIMDGVGNIANYAFYDCDNLRRVRIPDSVADVGKSAFQDCDNLSSVTTDGEMNQIGASAFQDCERLVTLNLSGSVGTIGANAFSGCTALTELDLSSGVHTLEESAFQGCSSLTSVILPDTLTSLGKYAFSESGLISITIPGSLRYVEEYAFAYCPQLRTVVLKEGVTTLWDYAFNSCPQLADVTLPVSMQEIGFYVFDGCSSLSNVYYDGSQAQWLPLTNGLVGNAPLICATIHYNHSGNPDDPVNDPVDDPPVTTYTVTFDPAGGSVETNCVEVTPGATFGILPVPVRDGYTFGGWFTESNGGSMVTEDMVVEFLEGQDNLTLYAHWTEVVVKTSFDVTKDAYYFGNSARDFGYTSTAAGEDTYPIPYSSVKYIFGDSVKGKSIYRDLIRYNWSGNCCGMASTVALMYEGTLAAEQDFSAGTVSTLTLTQTNGELDGLDVKTFIEAMQVAQNADSFSEAYKNNRLYKIQLDSGQTLNSLCDAVRTDMAQGSGTVIAIGKEGIGGHALLAYDLTEDNSTLHIYDCNYPMAKREIHLTSDSDGNVTGWTYDMGSYGMWGSDDPYCFISFIPYSVIETIWKNRGNLLDNRTLLCVNNENISIQDFNGQTVAELRDGKLITTSDEISEVPNLSLSNSPTSAIYLPKDYYTVTAEGVNEANPFEASMVDRDRGATVQTTAKSISFAVDDASMSNQVTIENATVWDRYTVSLEMPNLLSSSGGAVVYDNVTISGTGKGQSISIASIAGALSISNCNVNSLSINGEEQVCYTISALAGSGGKISPSGDQKVPAGDSCTLTFTPDPGYRVKSVQIDNSDIGVCSEYTLTNIGKDHTVVVQFEERNCSIQSAVFDSAARKATAEVVCDGEAVLIAALYGADGAMLAVASQSIRSGGIISLTFPTVTQTPDLSACTVKMFLLDANFHPLCAAYKI